MKLGHEQNAWKVCLCRKTAHTRLMTSTGVRIPPCFLVWGDLVDGGASNLGGKNKLLPRERHSEPSISSNIPSTGAFLVEDQFPETAAVFPDSAFQELTSWQPAASRWPPPKDQSCDLGFHWEPGSPFGGKVHLSRNGCQPFKSREPIGI